MAWFSNCWCPKKITIAITPAGAPASPVAGRLVATRCLVAEGHVDVWDAEHRRAAEALALGWKTDRCDLHVIESAEESASVERLELNGDYDIDPRDLNDRYPVTIDALSNGGVSA